MKLFEGKTPTERNKIIAAIVLGVLAVLMLTYTFGGMFFGKKTTVTATKSPTPKPTGANNNASKEVMPSQSEIYSNYASVPVDYRPGSLYAPDAGRNIFAFYEPPPPTPYSPTPTPSPTQYIPDTPVPTPTPPLTIFTATAGSGAIIYAGQNGFQIDVSGDKFTPESRILVNGMALPTNFVNSQRLTAQIPSDLIRNAGNLIITVATPDGKLYSNPVAFNIQSAPQPQFEYIGVTIRKGNNNSSADILEGQAQRSVRLNDDIGGRFKVVSISRTELKVQDKFLGFEYRKLMKSIGGGTTSTNNNNPRGVQTNPTFNNTNPTTTNPNPNCPPGIPCDKFPIVTPNNTINNPNQDQRQKQTKDDYDDDGDN
ncbi:MAG TPA: hypothetical protein PKE69_20605 [Pyrinomonadaceae bacterium]|nr:hypothetical protein [Pyrinomonadaceae bacterium]